MRARLAKKKIENRQSIGAEIQSVARYQSKTANRVTPRRVAAKMCPRGVRVWVKNFLAERNDVLRSHIDQNTWQERWILTILTSIGGKIHIKLAYGRCYIYL